MSPPSAQALPVVFSVAAFRGLFLLMQGGMTMHRNVKIGQFEQPSQVTVLAGTFDHAIRNAKTRGKETPFTALPNNRDWYNHQPMSAKTLCIGSVLWDVIGHADRPMEEGFDRPGNISRHPGGVALNVAYALKSANVPPTLLTAVGTDADGDALLARVSTDGIDCSHVTRIDARTDMYMAIEHDGNLFGAVADCAALERAGDTIFAPLQSGAVTDGDAYKGIAVIDGNLPVPVLEYAVNAGFLNQSRIIFVPASPGKARRMVAVLKSANAILCVNKIEAEIICDAKFKGSQDAAHALGELGTSAIVTDSAKPAALIIDGKEFVTQPPKVDVYRITGAGDAFLAGFVAAQIQNASHGDCLDAAAQMAAKYISEPPL